MHPLDGLRAIAIFWVMLVHIPWRQYINKCSGPSSFLARLAFNGDLGVDIFFCLSGFLIGYILLKECQKYNGKIDINHFLRNRFLRIWPSLPGICIPMMFIPEVRTSAITSLFFLNNMIANITITWSVAVEFQFYMISPYIIYAMYRSKQSRIWIIPTVFFLVSTVLNVFVALEICPKGFKDMKVWTDEKGVCNHEVYLNGMY